MPRYSVEPSRRLACHDARPSQLLTGYVIATGLAARVFGGVRRLNLKRGGDCHLSAVCPVIARLPYNGSATYDVSRVYFADSSFDPA
ncbi:hypothetical protein PM082_020294 [Marasmius tenuissimus]|nr:hypothetical protein PM082_020294 [Marasmius tenuissimus]